MPGKSEILPFTDPAARVEASGTRRTARADVNRLAPEDAPVHDWYRFVLSFPPHLVRQYLGRFAQRKGARVLDPFCGTGTTLVESKKLGLASTGTEANPMPCLASQVKTDWGVSPARLRQNAKEIAEAALAEMRGTGVDDFALGATPGRLGQLRGLPQEEMDLLLTDSISPLPLHKTLILLDKIKSLGDERLRGHELLALAKALVKTIGNLHFGPEVGVGRLKTDAPVVAPWLANVASMAGDLEALGHLQDVECTVHRADARNIGSLLPERSVDAVITSPPYPNEKDYTRTTRLESVLLGLVRHKGDLRRFKRSLVRSNTRSVYKTDDDDQWVRDHPEVQRIAHEIETRRVAMGKTSGFERMYHRVTRLYFGGMARHLAELKRVLRPGADLAYVVGDQASYLRVMIRTGQILADIAASLGYQVVGIDLFRTRLATATREQLREEVVVMKWPG